MSSTSTEDLREFLVQISDDTVPGDEELLLLGDYPYLLVWGSISWLDTFRRSPELLGVYIEAANKQLITKLRGKHEA